MFDLTAEEARLLLNVALMAAGANRFKSAATIFAALERFRPASPQVAAGKAIALISAQRFGACLDYLDGEALRNCPGDPMLLAFKGMALMRAGRVAEAREPLEAAASQTADPAAARLASGLLGDLTGQGGVSDV